MARWWPGPGQRDQMSSSRGSMRTFFMRSLEHHNFLLMSPGLLFPVIFVFGRKSGYDYLTTSEYLDYSILYCGLRYVVSVHDVFVCIYMRRGVDIQASHHEGSPSSDGAHQLLRYVPGCML